MVEPKAGRLLDRIVKVLPVSVIILLTSIVPMGGVKWFVMCDLLVIYAAWKNDNHTGSCLMLVILFNIVILVIALLMVAMALTVY
ncbi:hypothetical protein BRX37_03430 [Sphingomonas sp. S-NIH.Pt3_0716]|nr:hypothetical protein BRX37_03430 [Sphingomonas sp. S-NIH.Pt3_0716]